MEVGLAQQCQHADGTGLPAVKSLQMFNPLCIYYASLRI